MQLGELAAIATAVLWTCSAVAWTAAGRYIGALPISFLRLLITCPLLLGYGLIARGDCLPTGADGRTWVVLGISGLMGFFVSDLCLFRAFQLIGPRLGLLLQALTPPLAALLSWAFLGDVLTWRQWLAMAVTLAGIVWVVIEQDHDRQGKYRREDLRPGLLLALGAAVTQAASVVLSKHGIGDYDAGAATMIRVLPAIAGYVVLVTLLRTWPATLRAARQARPMLIVSLGAVVGPFLGVICSMVALRHCPAGVVSTIIATMPVLILPPVILIFREHVSLRAVGGAVLSIAGVAMLLL
jgi:drug/metabolite transporter (DMT)-like permease